MRMPASVALWLQKMLKQLSYATAYAEEFIAPLYKDESPAAQWQRAVDMVYRLLMSGLIQPTCGTTSRGVAGQEDHLAYVKALAANDPFSADVSVNIQWSIWDLEESPSCKQLIERHGIRELAEGVICESLADEVEAIFAAHGVAWTTAPLIAAAVAPTGPAPSSIGSRDSEVHQVEPMQGSRSPAAPEVVFEVSHGEVVGRGSDGAVLWRRGLPSPDEWCAPWRPIDLEARLSHGEYRYIQSKGDSYVVVVFAPMGGLDWNVWFDATTGRVLKVAEAR